MTESLRSKYVEGLEILIGVYRDLAEDERIWEEHFGDDKMGAFHRGRRGVYQSTATILEGFLSRVKKGGE